MVHTHAHTDSVENDSESNLLKASFRNAFSGLISPRMIMDNVSDCQVRIFRASRMENLRMKCRRRGFAEIPPTMLVHLVTRERIARGNTDHRPILENRAYNCARKISSDECTHRAWKSPNTGHRSIANTSFASSRQVYLTPHRESLNSCTKINSLKDPYTKKRKRMPWPPQMTPASSAVPPHRNSS